MLTSQYYCFCFFYYICTVRTFNTIILSGSKDILTWSCNQKHRSVIIKCNQQKHISFGFTPKYLNQRLSTTHQYKLCKHLVKIYSCNELVNSTFVSGEKLNTLLFTRCLDINDLTLGIGSEEAVNTILTSTERCTSFVRV